ncbi:MAG: SMC-Scp complex subunit ScpB [Candidatus Magasanikbacteria bacterium]
MNLESHIESILFVASKPLAPKHIAKSLGTSISKVEETIETLVMKYNHDDSGIHILRSEESVRMSTNPENASILEDFIKQEAVSELTKAQLETLTVVAYRSPVTRPELEQIRGVNCAVILRNLLIRGLIIEEEDMEKLLPVYSLSLEALSHLGVQEVTKLPEYDTLHTHEHLNTEEREG